MGRLRRLDAELVRRGLARSRGHAGELVSAGHVLVAGRPATKSATQVDPAAAIVVQGADDPGYASRGAHKLVGALDVFASAGLDPRGRDCLDAGASAGGFTDVLLRRGAARVAAVDVGYGQLVWRLQQDPRVSVLDRQNVRELVPGRLPFVPDLVVGDLSFISLRLVLPALVVVAAPDADLVLMVKPQFEVGRERLGSGGVVRDPASRADAVRGVAVAAAGAGLGVRGVVASPLPGPSGNVEYFLWLRRGPGQLDEQALARAIAEGPGGVVGGGVVGGGVVGGGDIGGGDIGGGVVGGGDIGGGVVGDGDVGARTGRAGR
jgi:23S rRNA (cytidine1920-2'-O)/16S rRNA (cytidine1409-2'-O)-methyltransferase